VRGSHEFDSVVDYQAWLEGVVDKTNGRNQKRIEEERPHLQPLPACQAADYTELWVRVTSSSTIAVRLMVYSVPSRLIGERLRVHLYDNRLVCYLGTTHVLTRPRVYAPKGKRRGRCMAFYHSRLRDELLPSEDYRRIWEVLQACLEPRSACRLMVGVLALAAEYGCEEALGEYLLQAIEQEALPSLVELQHRFGRPLQAVPIQQLEQHRLQSYDELLASLHQDGQEVSYG
jgi:hypothetical protein